MNSVGELVADIVDWFHDQVDGDDPVESCEADGVWIAVTYESGGTFVIHVSVDD